MLTKLNTTNRVNIGLSLAIVFLLVLATNRIDKRHFETVQNTLNTIHNDRILAQDYVYKMSGILHQKRILLLDSTAIDKEIVLNTQFETLIDVFAKTKLTTNESKKFKSLQKNFNELNKIEQSNFNSGNNKNVTKYLDALETDLNNLALIQVSESKNLISIAQKSLDNNKFISNLEIGFLILVGFIVQFVIFYRVKKQKSEL
ncbi:hypothetical protein FDT66_02725 [Polaribacter aestuariivivens]|uniref:Chemotaxis methyl-accepting receptor HlyB-like 4HB MCP domain-containing protein n=1 Tax=Polaribacter aestuariivivens TaxID=2304626 RepID=A0A5S3NAR2_9FLAO|nr:hypothetical protein [Polaribacter aestuariivivens]TMM32398.1 hypothetical protein FDT66_02725 [Polaribacter aestuariivivens]